MNADDDMVDPDESTADAAGGSADDAHVDLVIPARPAHVRLARLVASGLGVEMALDVDHVEDLRLVVNEACGIALECCRAAPETTVLALEFDRRGSTLRLQVTRDGAEAFGDPSMMSVAVLDEMAKSWHFDRDRCAITVEFWGSDG
jgi:hypothetical protein